MSCECFGLVSISTTFSTVVFTVGFVLNVFSLIVPSGSTVSSATISGSSNGVVSLISFGCLGRVTFFEITSTTVVVLVVEMFACSTSFSGTTIDFFFSFGLNSIETSLRSSFTCSFSGKKATVGCGELSSSSTTVTALTTGFNVTFSIADFSDSRCGTFFFIFLIFFSDGFMLNCPSVLSVASSSSELSDIRSLSPICVSIALVVGFCKTTSEVCVISCGVGFS